VEIGAELHAPLVFTLGEETSEYAVELFPNGGGGDPNTRLEIENDRPVSILLSYTLCFIYFI
jgi:hypothetical protein